MKISLTVIASTAASAAGAALDVVPRWMLLVFVVFVLLCACVHLALAVMRDVRDFRAGE